MQITGTQSCAIREIYNLSYDASAKDAMISFCKQELAGGLKVENYIYNKNYKPVLYGFYIFSEAVSHDGRESTTFYGEGAANGRKYATELKRYILDHNLGVVAESVVAPNYINHPDHSNQVFVYTPDVDRLIKWWKENEPKTVVEAAAPTASTPQQIVLQAAQQPPSNTTAYTLDYDPYSYIWMGGAGGSATATQAAPAVKNNGSIAAKRSLLDQWAASARTRRTTSR